MEKTRREFIKTIGMGTGGLLMSESLFGSTNQAFRPDAQPGEHVLPELPYAYNSLKPIIDEQTLRLHHDKHHAGYVRGLNAAEIKLSEARQKNEYVMIKHLECEIAFHGSGHILHSIYWRNLSPSGGGEPGGKLSEAIRRTFGNFDMFRAQMIAATKSVEGSGWGVFGFNPIFGQLTILQAEKHQNLTQWGCIPMFVIDVWEHAYYLKYQNRRAEYVEKCFEIINWKHIQQQFDMLTG